jgi:ERCC4-type nuclease
MVIIVDDREKDTPLLHQRLNSFPCAYMRKRLDFGDYSAEVTLPNGEKFSLADKVTIERKSGLDEICGNFTTNRIRFAKEFDRATAAGAKTYILIENGS